MRTTQSRLLLSSRHSLVLQYTSPNTLLPTSHARILRATFPHTRRFTSTPFLSQPNRIYQPVRSSADLENLLLQTASSRTALITLWTASWCSTCKQVLPVVQSTLQDDGVGEAEGGAAFAEVEIDAPGNEELSQRYMITSVPTLLAFSRQEAQMGTRVVSATQMKDREFLREWIRNEAKRGGDGGAGGVGWLGKVFQTFGGKS